MPLYAHACDRCGPFESFRPLARAGAPAPCPECGAPARRVYTPPALARLARPMRRALDGEERSAHEPRVTDRKSGAPLPHSHQPGPPWAMSH